MGPAPAPVPFILAPVATVPIPASTMSYRKRKELEHKTAVVPTKRYKPRVGASKCSKCPEEKTDTTGHKPQTAFWQLVLPQNSVREL